MHNRFKIWENKLDDDQKELQGIKDTKQHVSRIEWKANQPVEKVFEAKVLLVERKLTKGAMERRKLNPTFDAFGVGEPTLDNFRLNQNITMIQRDNIWHPYYEIKLDEEDLGTKFRKNVEAKREKNIDGEAIEELQKQIQDLEKTQRDENEKKLADASGNKKPQKKIFDAKAIQAQKAVEESQH